jgi:hypothetical protein
MSISNIERAAQKNKYKNICFKTIGYTFVPFCCLGFFCIGSSMHYKEFHNSYKRLIDFYGGQEAAREMAQNVKQQTALFKKAVKAVNKKYRPSESEKSLTLFELVKRFNTKFYLFCEMSRIKIEKNSKYMNLVWETYSKYGGIPEYIIYGFIECVLQNTNPNSAKAIHYAISILENPYLQAEMLAAKKVIDSNSQCFSVSQYSFL